MGRKLKGAFSGRAGGVDKQSWTSRANGKRPMSPSGGIQPPVHRIFPPLLFSARLFKGTQSSSKVLTTVNTLNKHYIALAQWLITLQYKIIIA